MNELQVIDKREILGKQFRVYGDFENLLFLAKDVAEWIDYSKKSNGSYDVNSMLRTIDEDEKLIRKIFVSGRKYFPIRSMLVKVGKNTKIVDSIIRADTEIGDNVTIRKAIIANNVKIADNINIGDGEKITVVGEKKIIDSQSLVK